MSITDYYVAMILSVLLSLAAEEMFGLLSGGMIVPGIIALHITSPATVLLMLSISIVIYIFVDSFLSKHMILFGRRKFGVYILTALLLKIFFEVSYEKMPYIINSYRGISAIAPALLASTYSKQGIKYTMPTTLILSLIIYVGILIIN